MQGMNVLRMYRETLIELRMIEAMGEDLSPTVKKEQKRLSSQLSRLKAPAEGIIAGLKNRVERMVMTGYYMEGLSIMQAAAKYHYSYGYMRAVKCKAVSNVSKMDKMPAK